MTITTRKLSDRHEEDLAAILGGQMTKGSGNQFNDPMDGKHEYGSQRYTFAWDGKSSLGRSVSVSREMWAKAVDQARSFLPMVALRLYRSERLQVDMDLVAVEVNTFAEILETANRTPQEVVRALEIEGVIKPVHWAPDGEYWSQVLSDGMDDGDYVLKPRG